MTRIRFSLPAAASDPTEFLVQDRGYRITHAGPETWLIDGHAQWILRYQDGWYQLVPPHDEPKETGR